MKEVSQLSATEVHEKYWTIHSTEYKQRIDTLAEQVKAEKKEKIEQCKVLVVMAAMNETELELAYGALRDNYTSPEAFDAQVVLVIYHNHRENPGLIDPQVVQSVSLVTQFSNVVCIDEQVGTAAGINSDVAKAKKVAADVSLRLVGAQKKQILFIDGDLRKISPRGTLEQMQSRLSVEDGDVALSTVYCHDSRIDAHFPALAEYFRLVESISKQAQASSNDPVFTLGGFTMIDSTMFMAAGGWPISKPEDIHFTYRLLHIFCRLHVVRSLFPYVRVEMDVGREVQSILERKSAHHRWLGENHDEYMFISGSRRLALDSIPSGAIADVPLLHEQDAQRAVLVAINTNYLEFVKEMQNKKPDDQEIFQKRLKSRATQIFNFLKDMGISQVTIDAYHINPNSPTKESAQLNLDLNDPQIVDVFFQKYILTSFVALQSSQLKS